jgi:uncharacterized membrane protein YphA (DoxX/SURF4 family)
MIGSRGGSTPVVGAAETAPIGGVFDRERWEPALLILARLLVGGTFLLAGATKVRAPAGFADSVRAYHLLPAHFVLPFATGLPWLELLVAAYLLVGFMTRIGAALSIAMLAMFEYALIYSLATGNIHHACGCFGSKDSNPILAFIAGGNTVTLWDVIRDAILAVLAALIVWWGAGRFSIDAQFGNR